MLCNRGWLGGCTLARPPAVGQSGSSFGSPGPQCFCSATCEESRWVRRLGLRSAESEGRDIRRTERGVWAVCQQCHKPPRSHHSCCSFTDAYCHGNGVPNPPPPPCLILREIQRSTLESFGCSVSHFQVIIIYSHKQIAVRSFGTPCWGAAKNQAWDPRLLAFALKRLLLKLNGLPQHSVGPKPLVYITMVRKPIMTWKVSRLLSSVKNRGINIEWGAWPPMTFCCEQQKWVHVPLIQAVLFSSQSLYLRSGVASDTQQKDRGRFFFIFPPFL